MLNFLNPSPRLHLNLSPQLADSLGVPTRVVVLPAMVGLIAVFVS